MNPKKKLPEANKQKIFYVNGLRWLLPLLFFITLYKVGMHWLEPNLLPIRHIKMECSCEMINFNSLKKHISPHIKGFFSTNVLALKSDLLSEPLVDKVTIKRYWPDTLLIKLTEMKFVGRWGKEGRVNSKGEVISITLNDNDSLPLFSGPDPKLAPRVLDVYSALSTILKPYNLAITEIDLNPMHSWQIVLDNRIKIFLGRKDLNEHIATFVAAYPKLKKMHGKNIVCIDLRHSNGLSVQLDSHQDGVNCHES